MLGTKDPKKAAKNVQCVHTSNNFGTNIYSCHQNWRMGTCGFFQPVVPIELIAPKCDMTMSCLKEPLISHNMCPDIYISAFQNDFPNNDKSKCISFRRAQNVPVDYTMGYDETKT